MSDIEQRWRLILGKYAEPRLPLAPSQHARDRALGYLYDRLYTGRGLRGDAEGVGSSGGGPGESQQRSAGLEDSAPHLVDWLQSVNELFPNEVAEELTAEAVERFGLTQLLTDSQVLERVEPNLHTLQLLLSLKSDVPAEALGAVRRIVADVVEDLMQRLRTEIEAVLTGRVNPQSRTRRPTGVIDARRTIEENLGTWDPERRRLLIEEVSFFRRSRVRYPWEIILCVDQSGSMVGSVIHSAVLAGVLSGLPGVSVKVVVFDTAVIDLSHLSDDPVETLMSVQLGGGTDIDQAVRYCEQIVTNPSRTIVALITDFYEGGSVQSLLATVGRLSEAGVTLMGLAALDEVAAPAFDHHTAERVVNAGMPVAAMTPKSFAQWAAGVMR
ncbi:MAG: VWA domain-containing protein [Acidimicrobiales bacterium]